MSISPTDFQNPDNFFRDYGDIEFEPIDPDDPGNGTNDMGCCRCMQPGQCQKDENYFGSAVTSFLGVTVGAAVAL